MGVKRLFRWNVDSQICQLSVILNRCSCTNNNSMARDHNEVFMLKI